MAKKRIATLLIALATAILVVLALCFNMFEYRKDSGYSLKLNGFEIMNGWKLDERIYCSEWLRIFNILMLLVGVGEIAVVGYLTYNKHEKLQYLLTTCVIINVILVTVYMINGFILSREITDYYGYSDREFTTKTYWPFLLMVAEAIVYFAIEKNTKETFEPTVICLKEAEIVELLLKYKSLLDQDGITQEEYDKKKTELLN
ncbi:MAG: SHOCT domain-containing protein [Clostridia bacterium]|nr:SHOCT domain-containing protein [Clostridia bacterium]